MRSLTMRKAGQRCSPFSEPALVPLDHVASFIVKADHSIMLVGGFGPQEGIALPYACDTVPLPSIPPGVFAMLDLCQAHRISRSCAGDL